MSQIPAAMKAAILYAPLDLRYETTRVPEFAEDELLIRVRASLTCGTDQKAFLRGHPKIPIPGPLGHEFSGEVAAVGRLVLDFRVGDRAAGAWSRSGNRPVPEAGTESPDQLEADLAMRWERYILKLLVAVGVPPAVEPVRLARRTQRGTANDSEVRDPLRAARRTPFTAGGTPAATPVLQQLQDAWRSDKPTRANGTQPQDRSDRPAATARSTQRHRPVHGQDGREGQGAKVKAVGVVNPDQPAFDENVENDDGVKKNIPTVRKIAPPSRPD
jgi:hypothetical protein